MLSLNLDDKLENRNIRLGNKDIRAMKISRVCFPILLDHDRSLWIGLSFRIIFFLVKFTKDTQSKDKMKR
ncbi:14603_t:CDS:2 [Dentiscutata heterogama]|uniref:14603_t:CDS:1 n=1 Tax=Dentiscutata heterogama TaxID=1316150 RepID=A0ACA9K5L6_9GLOM|nr:14603_t:CDS:2 [Dentiscutata heterogama]